ncbi:MAG TPA: hypothetical protein ENK18_07530 [Deltaproteobacteria bacterium]|nr:hypothetical protein [Deltaproteobacteria bacterium]
MSSLSALIDRGCQRLYVLGLILGGLVLALAPLHGAATVHWLVIRSLPDHRIEIVADTAPPEVGQVLPIHRHNPSWRYPIGRATVESVQGPVVIARFDPSTFRWPMGRHATVIEERGQEVVLDLGFGAGATVGLRLNGLTGDRAGLVLRVIEVSEQTSVARIVRRSDKPGGLVGASVTEFAVPTRASPLASTAVAWLEGLLLGGALLLWGVGLWHPGPGRAWALGCRWVRGRLAQAASLAVVRLAFHALVGLAVPAVLVPFVFWSTTWIAHSLSRWLLSWGVPLTVPPPFPDSALPMARIAGGVAYYGWLLRTRSSPLLALWRALSYRRIELAWFPLGRGIGLWGLHLIIAYAFASTLTSFLGSNLTELGAILWPGTGVSFHTVAGAQRSLPIVLSTLPTVRDELAVLESTRYLLWSATICGCLLGYGHTVLAILWKHPLRNLDFTVAGWVTNAMCYGPLLGGVVHHLLADGDYTGPDPIVTEGPLYVAVLGVEVLLNLLYTATVWNLGVYFGVMSDKGLRDTGFFTAVRHPSYTLEALMFMVMFVPGLTTPIQWITAGSFLLKYWLRSEREDHFLGVAMGPEHEAYRRQVPFKFVPGLY